MENYLSLPEKFIISEYKLKHDNPNYDKEARMILQQIKNLFPQFSLFADKVQESFYKTLTLNNRQEAIQANHLNYKSTDFQFISRDEIETQKFIDNMKNSVKMPQILDFILRINYIYDLFPSLTPNLDNLLLLISMQNEYPLIKLVLISQLFSMPSRRVQEKISEFETIDMKYPGEIVSCIFDPKNQEILPLTLNNPLFPVSTDSIYLRFYKHDYVFTPSTKTVSFCQTGPKNRISTKNFSDFLINDEEKIEEIGVFNKQLCFVQQFESDKKKLRISLFEKGILVKEIIKKFYIIDLNDEYEKCKLYQNNLMIFMANGKKFIYNISKHILVKDPNESQFYFDYNKVSIYDKLNEVFILTNRDNDKLIYQIIKKEKKKSNFIQILPPFYGVQTDEIISRVSFELLNLCTEVISDLMESNTSIKTNLVSDPILHIEYALDLSETIQKNDFNHDQNLCDYCLIAITRFIIINIYQMNANQQKLADFHIRRITRLFNSMKMSPPHFDTLFGLVSIINYGIYTKSFISNILHPFFPLLDQKRILQVPSFVLFIKPENINSMNIKEKMTFLQNRIEEFINIYNERHLDKELIPFISTYFEVLQDALISKSIPNKSISSYFSSLIPFLCIMKNTPQLSLIVLRYLIKNMNKLFERINPVVDKISKFFEKDDDLNHFKESKTINIKFPVGWIDDNFEVLYQRYDIDNNTIAICKEVQNESLQFFNDITKDELLIFLFPNAIINCIQNCYDSIEITQEEIDNKFYLSYQIKQVNSKEATTIMHRNVNSKSNIPKRTTSNTVPSSHEEKDFLLQLNEESIIIKRLRKEIKSIFRRNIDKETEEVEILIFKALLYQSQLCKYAMSVNESSQINPQIKFIWKTAIKIRADLHLSKQLEVNKQEVHLNLKERYNDYIESIKEKCAFLLEQNIFDNENDTNEWVKQNYSFITSNLPLSQLFKLHEIIKKREEIRNESIVNFKKILKMKIPKSFMRSIISYLAKNETLKKVLNEDDDFYSFLVNSNDPFVRLCTFDFINTDEFEQAALELQEKEDNTKVLTFIRAIIDVKQDDVDVNHLLEIIGKGQYDIENNNHINVDCCIKKVSKIINFESLVKKLNGFDDISLGVLAVIDSFSSIEEKYINLLIPILIKLQSQLPADINNEKNKAILNLFVSSLNLIFQINYNLFKTKIMPQIDLSKYGKNIIPFINTDIQIPDIIELFHEVKEKQPKSKEFDNNPYFIQMKGSLPTTSENKPDEINSLRFDYNFYVFSKPIENDENIHFHINRICDEPISDNSYILLGTIDMNDRLNCIIPTRHTITNHGYTTNSNKKFYMDTSLIIDLTKIPNKNNFSFYSEYTDLTPENDLTGPLIPFILIFDTDVSITYYYFKNTELRIFDLDEYNKIQIENEEHIDINDFMTVVPSNITGNKIHIENAGDGIVIKTNDKNDDAEIALFNDNGIANLAIVNLTSKKINIKKEPIYLTLLRGIIISGGLYDESVVDRYLSLSLSMMLSKSLYRYFFFNLLNPQDLSYFNTELFNEISKDYKTSLTCLFNDNIEKCVNLLSKDHIILSKLLEYDMIDDPIYFTLLVSDITDDIEFIFFDIKYKKIQYEKMDIEIVKSRFENICKKFKNDKYVNYDIFLSLFRDILEYLLVNSFETVDTNFENINEICIINNLYLNCNKPTGIPMLLGVIFNHYKPEKTFTINPNQKFILSMKCQNVESKEILNINIEYEFDHEIELLPIKPEISDIFEFIKTFNETDHIDTFLKLHENKSDLITYSTENLSDEKVNSEVLYLYMILFEILNQNEYDELFVLKSLEGKIEWLQDEIIGDEDYDSEYEALWLSFMRFQKIDQKKLLFDQFYDQVNSCLSKLTNTTPFKASFKGEGGIDEGGLRREVITLIYEELIDPKNQFFELQDDGFLVPSNQCDKKRLEVVGAFIACCFYSENPHDFNLSPKIWQFFISCEPNDYEKMDEFVAALKRGFNAVIPEFHLRYFTAQDIKQLTCGDSLTFEKFIRCCRFYDENIKTVFTEAVSKFSQEELKRLLQFITGTQTLSFDSNSYISIEFVNGNGNDEIKWPLPQAHTCFYTIDICPFTDSNILSDKLKMAMLTEIISDSNVDYGILNFV